MCDLFCEKCLKPCGSKSLGEDFCSLKNVSGETMPVLLIPRKKYYNSERTRTDILKRISKNNGQINCCGISTVTIIPEMSDHLKSFQLDPLNTIYDMEYRKKLNFD